DPLPDLGAIDGIMVSGGVGEFVYGRETREFGDTGLALGQSLTAHIDAGRLPWPLMSAVECIRATVLGASACSVQLSGRTGWISSPARLLPRRNLQVLHPRLDLGDDIDPGRIADAIRAHLRAFDAGTGDEDIALAIGWLGLPDYPRLKGLAQGIADGLGDRFGAGRPAYIIIDGDIARSLGAMLTDELQISSDLLVLDGIRLADFDYIDLGRIRMPSQTVPVTIKTLVFRQEGVQKRRTR
ncbi:MAG: ethanolamine ammonia-lyase reactivating factor EutA, partial [Hyphomicrobiaceae bacterium]